MILDHAAYPEVLDRVISHLDWRTLQTMRRTSKTINDKVCRIIYRHVVLVEPSRGFSARLTVRDPYFLKPLLTLDKKAGRVRSSSRNHQGQIRASVSVEDGMVRLRKYTEIYSGDWPYGHGAWKYVQPALTHVDIVRENLSAVVPTALPHRQATIFVTLNSLPPHPGSVWRHDLVFTRGLQPPGQLVVVVNHRYFDVPFLNPIHYPCYRKLSAIGHILKSIIEGFSINITNLVLIRNHDTLPQAAYWDTFLERLEKMWNEKINSEKVPNAVPITFSHTTPEDYQRDSGMSNIQLHMLLTLPDSKMPVPAVWTVPPGYRE